MWAESRRFESAVAFLAWERAQQDGLRVGKVSLAGIAQPNFQSQHNFVPGFGHFLDGIGSAHIVSVRRVRRSRVQWIGKKS
jgi:hypothetical protein